MTKAELINAIAEKGEFSKKDAEKAVKTITEVITDALVAGDKVQIVGFGTFEARERKARKNVNPQTHETTIQPAKTVPAFKAGKALKEAVEKK